MNHSFGVDAGVVGGGLLALITATNFNILVQICVGLAVFTLTVCRIIDWVEKRRDKKQENKKG